MAETSSPKTDQDPILKEDYRTIKPGELAGRDSGEVVMRSLDPNDFLPQPPECGGGGSWWSRVTAGSSQPQAETGEPQSQIATAKNTSPDIEPVPSQGEPMSVENPTDEAPIPGIDLTQEHADSKQERPIELVDLRKELSDPRLDEIDNAIARLDRIVTAMNDLLSDKDLRVGEAKTYRARRETASKEIERLNIERRAIDKNQRGREAYQRGLERVRRRVERVLNVPEVVAGTIVALPDRIEGGLRRVEHGVQNTLNRMDASQARLRNRLADDVVDTMKSATGWAESKALSAKGAILDRRARLAEVTAGARAIVTELQLRGNVYSLDQDRRRAEIARQASEDAWAQGDDKVGRRIWAEYEALLRQAVVRQKRVEAQIKELDGEKALGSTPAERLYTRALDAKGEAEKRKGNGRALSRFRNWLGKLIDAR